MPGHIVRIAVTAAALLGASVALAGVFDLPRPAPPDRYGTVLIERAASSGSAKAVIFSHWRHRARYSCRVCHYELGFELETNATMITEEDNRNGEFCGACHDGTAAFAVADEAQCSRCHAGKIRTDKKAFADFSKKLPKAPYGNKVDWVAARKILEPKYAIYKDEKPLDFDKELLLEARWFNISPAVFPHKEHVELLDCANCHPDVFNIKKKTTEHFEMRYILEGSFCGACHLTVAFPLDDCVRCHPEMKKH